jgi:long-chain acyl-CoA synthetase
MKLAGALRGLGLGPGGRVAILALNSDRFLEYLYAVPWAGGIVVPVNVRLAPPEILQILEDSGSEILIVDDAFQAMLPAFHGRMASVRHVVLASEGPAPDGPAGFEIAGFEEILAATEPVDDAGRHGEDVAGIFYTGGTTGRAKGVMLTHANLLANSTNLLAALSMDAQTVYLHAAPMFHLSDLGSTFGVTMAGGTHAFIPKFDPAATLRAIQEDRVTFCALLPVMVGMIVQRPDVGDYDLSSLRTIGYGGSPMPDAVLAGVMRALPACRLSQAYGMTELSPVATLLRPEDHAIEGPLAGRLRSAGRVIEGLELKIVDAQDDEVPRGAAGEIIVRGPTVMKGYWNQPEATAQALRGGWMHTGDMGTMDGEGFLYVVDRLKDMIITGGENVYSAEVENAIHQHPAVAMCAVIGIPSTQWGESVHAIAVPKDGHTLTEELLLAHCRERIAGYKCPRSVEIRPQPLPLSGAGKILKTELRRPFWEGQDRQVS